MKVPLDEGGTLLVRTWNTPPAPEGAQPDTMFSLLSFSGFLSSLFVTLPTSHRSTKRAALRLLLGTPGFLSHELASNPCKTMHDNQGLFCRGCVCVRVRDPAGSASNMPDASTSPSVEALACLTLETSAAARSGCRCRAQTHTAGLSPPVCVFGSSFSLSFCYQVSCRHFFIEIV